MLEPKLRALRSLQALSIGDAFGELFFTTPATALVGAHPLPPGPWTWTDDTHMALSITEALLEHGSIDQDDLAQRFACRFAAEPWRGYAGGAKSLLTAVARGEDWRPISRGLFGGTGSWGNGAAMRVAPLGAFFANDVSMAVARARWSAEVTHAHEEGVVGAVVVAAAAALRWAAPDVVGSDLLDAVLGWTPASRTRERIEEARSIAADRFGDASLRLGTGDDVAAWDTVPYCLWMCAHHGRDFELAMKATAAGLGDRDTTCAIVAGIVAPESADIPERWARETESLPDGLRMG